MPPRILQTLLLPLLLCTGASAQETLETNEVRQELEAELTRLNAEKQRLLRDYERRAEALTRELAKTREQKEVSEQRAAHAREAITGLSEEALEQRTLATVAREELAHQELRRNQAELLAQRQSYRLYLTLSALAVLSLLAYALHYRNQAKTRAAQALEATNRELKLARKQSDELLGNILPAHIAHELKTTGEAKARSFPTATVLFCDFVDFTATAQAMEPATLVHMLNRCFKAFDFIIDQYPGVEKIKTIGDAYLAASGLSSEPAPPHRILRAALEMQAFLNDEAKARRAAGAPYFTARIGLHTGPIVAGVVGARKFTYDIWGDTVNVASRMESKCAAGRVNVSASTQALSAEYFTWEERGELNVKGKGLLAMYYLTGLRHRPLRAASPD